eukprot:gnl/TRDRNA2_/TRDRNA2_182985_c0_seq1.p1 gnl/TRDRNA2_/TRDRNA2_182985_c0~~gnl/TRDRNA2_/TRDRNA2_182985_c0_seq1.p1  ORF type:complete len:217 (+),score=34.38 gnl/TRDRNA2_/TRDRNA2_182985_c0_seq1:138-788(+)
MQQRSSSSVFKLIFVACAATLAEGFRPPSREAHDTQVQPDAPRKILSVISLKAQQSQEAKVKPPEGSAVVRHNKTRGNGYQPGSPLYEKQEDPKYKDLKKGAKEKGAKDESDLPPVPGPSIWVSIIALAVGTICLALVWLFNRQASMLRKSGPLASSESTADGSQWQQGPQGVPRGGLSSRVGGSGSPGMGGPAARSPGYDAQFQPSSQSQNFGRP